MAMNNFKNDDVCCFEMTVKQKVLEIETFCFQIRVQKWINYLESIALYTQKLS